MLSREVLNLKYKIRRKSEVKKVFSFFVILGENGEKEEEKTKRRKEENEEKRRKMKRMNEKQVP